MMGCAMRVWRTSTSLRSCDGTNWSIAWAPSAAVRWTHCATRWPSRSPVKQALAEDLDEHHVYVRNVEVHLTSTEFRLLAYLLEHAGQLVTHRQVLASVWGGRYGADVHLLRMTIRNLRQKLEAVAPGETYFATE